MFTIRNLGGAALFLAGTTWLWLTPAFAGRSVTTSGALWAVTRVVSLATIAGFLLATWALFARQGWWETAAIGSAILGLLALLPYMVAASRGGEPWANWSFNAAVHVLMVAGVLVLLLVPTLESWVDRHFMGG